MITIFRDVVCACVSIVTLLEVKNESPLKDDETFINNKFIVLYKQMCACLNLA